MIWPLLLDTLLMFRQGLWHLMELSRKPIFIIFQSQQKQISQNISQQLRQHQPRITTITWGAHSMVRPSQCSINLTKRFKVKRNLIIFFPSHRPLLQGSGRSLHWQCHVRWHFIGNRRAIHRLCCKVIKIQCSRSSLITWTADRTQIPQETLVRNLLLKLIEYLLWVLFQQYDLDYLDFLILWNTK